MRSTFSLSVAPDWLLEQMKPEWSKRYQSRFSDFRLPKSEKSRRELAEEIGADGRYLLEKVYASTDYSWLQELPAIERVRCIWIQHYHGSRARTYMEKRSSIASISSAYSIAL